MAVVIIALVVVGICVRFLTRRLRKVSERDAYISRVDAVARTHTTLPKPAWSAGRSWHSELERVVVVARS